MIIKDKIFGSIIRLTKDLPKNKPCFIVSCNRGEIANDTLRAAKEIMEPAMFTATLHTIGDKQYGYVKQSEFSICIGPDNFSVEQQAKGRSVTPYMDIPLILTACKSVSNQAEELFGKNKFKIGVHPGYGMLSEEPNFIRECLKENIIFIGPGLKTQEAMGPKDSARQLAISTGIQVVPGEGNICSLDDAKKAYKKIITENPVLKGRRFRLKAIGGGGGRGQIVFDKNNLEKQWEKVCQVTRSLGWETQFVMELNIECSRHYEIQMFTDLTLFGRECTLMRNNQKEIEEFLSPELLKKTDENAAKELQKMLLAAPKLARACNLDSVATIECIYDENAEKLYFLEMNTRIQVEHPVTNMATGVDLLREQIRKAYGAKLAITQEEIQSLGSSIEARITNLDPYDPNYGPLGGKKVTTYLPPERTDRIRHYGYICAGNTLTSFDPMFAKIVARGQTRREATEALFRGLSEFIIEGNSFRHNIPHQLFVISHPKFLDHNYNSETMDEIRNLFLNKFTPFFDKNFRKENRYNSPIVAEAVNQFYGQSFH